MKTWIVSYADRSYRLSQERLMASALRAGIDERRAWGREALTRTWLYAAHQRVLDEWRGAGYWLWKPFIVNETLSEMADGDLVAYVDAGIEILASLRPIYGICADKTDILLCAGHYDDVGAPGPNVCGRWTKRDCFVCLGCDQPEVHRARMVDASFFVLRKTPRAVAFAREWLLWCCQRHLLTDDPNVCGRPNLPDFIDHRHDQSLLSLLAIREGLELFRHPSQYGNDFASTYGNSPYGTLLDHHRGRLGEIDLSVDLRRTVHAPREQVFRTWTSPEVLMKWSPGPLGHHVVRAAMDVRPGGGFQITLANARTASVYTIEGTYVTVESPSRLVYSWRWDSRVAVEFRDEGDGTAVVLGHGSFPTERLREYHTVGWSNFLDAVAAAVA